ncbi:MAG: hypothetical protein DMF78_08250 [Acidobacteria bacterium]|nr:MAG: hypothetical protein DMF78_08250 [Acidobacteriota bacterium]
MLSHSRADGRIGAGLIGLGACTLSALLLLRHDALRGGETARMPAGSSATRVWVKRRGQWQAVAAQATMIPADSAAR